MASISQIKLPNNSVYDIKAKYDISGNIISDTYLRKDFDSIGHNVSFNSSVDIDDLTAGTLLVTGAARFTNGLIGNLIKKYELGISTQFPLKPEIYNNHIYNSEKGCSLYVITNSVKKFREEIFS